jgi:HEAT repeat protein
MEDKRSSEEKVAEETPTTKGPIVTKSMCEGSCGAEVEPAMPVNLPEVGWSTEKLIAATKDENMLVRSNAIVLLSKRSPEESVEPLIQAMNDQEYVVKTNAMVALSAYGKVVLDRMIAALSDSNPDIRAGAAWVLGELKDQRSIEALEKVSKDDYPLARIQAKASLMAMGQGPNKAQGKAQPEEKREETREEPRE